MLNYFLESIMSETDNPIWKGIVLAGGAGTRLHPVTLTSSKQLLPVYNKPMIYYPLSLLMLGGIKDILIISTPHDLPRFRDLLGDGSRFGIKLSYKEQPKPEGLAQAFILGEEFIGDNNVSLILGDNLFYGHIDFLRDALVRKHGATVFGYPVSDPERYGVVEFDKDGKVISIEEKPENPKTHYAIPGLYCYDNNVIEYAKNMAPSARGELEITDLNRVYLEQGELNVELLGRGMAWLDTGTPQSMLDACNFVASIENRQGLMIGCIEEAAFRKGYIASEQLLELGKELGKSDYGKYLIELANEYDLK